MKFLIARLREPSTYAGIAAVVGGLSFLPDASAWAHEVTLIGAAVAGLIAILMPEQKQ